MVSLGPDLSYKSSKKERECSVGARARREGLQWEQYANELNSSQQAKVSFPKQGVNLTEETRAKKKKKPLEKLP